MFKVLKYLPENKLITKRKIVKLYSEESLANTTLTEWSRLMSQVTSHGNTVSALKWYTSLRTHQLCGTPPQTYNSNHENTSDRPKLGAILQNNQSSSKVPRSWMTGDVITACNGGFWVYLLEPRKDMNVKTGEIQINSAIRLSTVLRLIS